MTRKTYTRDFAADKRGGQVRGRLRALLRDQHAGRLRADAAAGAGAQALRALPRHLRVVWRDAHGYAARV